MDVVTDLLTLVSKDFVGSAFPVALDQIAEKSVQLDSAVIRAGQTAPAQAAGLHAEISPVFLDHDVRRHFGRAEQRVLGLIDTECLGNAVMKLPRRVVPTCRLLD